MMLKVYLEVHIVANKDLFGELFTIDEVGSDERYDLAKFMPWKEDTFDALNAPFLSGLVELPVWRYYRVNEGYKDIDLIAQDAYSTPTYSSLIQIYNGTTEEEFPEDTVLKLFNVDDVEQLYSDMLNKNMNTLS